MNVDLGIVFVIFLSTIFGAIGSLVAVLRLSFVSTIKEDNKRLREELESFKARLRAVEDKKSAAEKDVMLIRHKLSILETAHHDLPFPQWLKDTNGTMLSLNAAYEEKFLRPIGKSASDYEGFTDYDVWPEEVADKFTENDRKAQQSRGYWMGVEPIWLKTNNVSSRWRIVKYGRYVGNVCVGVAGIAIPILDEEIQEKADVHFIKYLLKHNKIRKALVEMEEIKDSEVQRSVISFQRRLASATVDKANDVITDKDFNMELNRIANGILKVLDY